MREIKFRAWECSKHVKRLSIGKMELFDDMLGFRFEHFDCDPEDIIFEQFTGIKDKNGREIYEGDKVKLIGDADYSRFDGWIVSMRTPEYIELVSPDGDDGIPFFSFEYHAEPEVIGNIHEKQERTWVRE